MVVQIDAVFQSAFNCSTSTMERHEHCVKSVQGL